MYVATSALNICSAVGCPTMWPCFINQLLMVLRLPPFQSRGLAGHVAQFDAILIDLIFTICI